MTSKPPIDDVSTITTLPDAINIIKFLKVSHKAELNKWMEACKKQTKIIKTLESNRHQELAYLSNQLHKYEFDLLERENDIAKQIAEKDKIIDNLNKTIESLQQELMSSFKDNVSEKTRSVSSDSGIVEDRSEVNSVNTQNLNQEKAPKNRRSSFSKSINFFRKVDFSPKKKKPENLAASESKKKSYSFRRAAKKSQEKPSSDDESSSSEDIGVFLVGSPRKMDESMTNHYCEEQSDSEREKIFDRVMARASVRRSIKVNSKYQKISRNKSKYLEELRNACEYTDSSV